MGKAMEKLNAGRKRQRFSKEFKLNAVALLKAGQKPGTQIALELGVRRNQLYKWASELEEKSGDVAAAFQESVVDILAGKTSRLARELGAAEVLVAGGVAANRRLREELARRCPVPVRIPIPRLCTDNAAMIGAAATHRLRLGERSPWDEDIFSTNSWEVPLPSAGERERR